MKRLPNTIADITLRGNRVFSVEEIRDAATCVPVFRCNLSRCFLIDESFDDDVCTVTIGTEDGRVLQLVLLGLPIQGWPSFYEAFGSRMCKCPRGYRMQGDAACIAGNVGGFKGIVSPQYELEDGSVIGFGAHTWIYWSPPGKGATLSGSIEDLEEEASDDGQ